MNKNVERLYNGIIKENPTFILMLVMCPDSCDDNICHQRSRHGTFHNSRTDVFQPADLRTA